jgi:ribonuclease D
VIDAFLTEVGARPWQRELTVPVLTEALTAPQPQQPEQAAE